MGTGPQDEGHFGVFDFRECAGPEEPGEAEDDIEEDQQPADAGGPGGFSGAPQEGGADQGAEDFVADEAGFHAVGEEVCGDGVDFTEHAVLFGEEGVEEVGKVECGHDGQEDGDAEGLGVEAEEGRAVGDGGELGQEGTPEEFSEQLPGHGRFPVQVRGDTMGNRL